MFHLIFWILKTLFLLLLELFFLLTFLFSVFSSIQLIKKEKKHIIILVLPLATFISYFFSYFLRTLLLFLNLIFIYILESTPISKPRLKFWTLITESLNTIIIVREALHIPDSLYFRLLKATKFFLIVFFIALIIIFCSSHQILIILLTLICSLTAVTLGQSLGFFSCLTFILFNRPSPQDVETSNFDPHLYLLSNKPTLKQLEIKNKSTPNLNNPLDDLTNPPLISYSTQETYKTPSSNFTPSISFALFLKKKIDSHPLNAIIEETFFEDNLQIGEFFLVYPLFFKVSSPSNYPSIEQEILATWHIIRWESAFSKQSGSASSRWTRIFDLKFTPIPSSTHSIHIPLIPIFNEELFSSLESVNLPTFNPFNQPPEWRSYDILTSLLGWSEEEKKEERLIEIEEED